MIITVYHLHSQFNQIVNVKLGMPNITNEILIWRKTNYEIVP